MTPPIASSIQFLYSSSFLFRSSSDGLLIARTTANSSSGKTSRKTSTRNLREAFVITSRSISKQRSHVGPVWFFMAAGGPTRALLQKIRVVDVSDENVSLYFLLLEMAFYAERRVTFIQQSLVDGSVR